jgi:hypothetical protein
MTGIPDTRVGRTDNNPKSNAMVNSEDLAKIRYRMARTVIRSDPDFDIGDLVSMVPITVLTDGVDLNYSTLAKRLLDPSKFTLGDLMKFAKAFDMDPQEWFDILSKKLLKSKKETEMVR